MEVVHHKCRFHRHLLTLHPTLNKTWTTSAHIQRTLRIRKFTRVSLRDSILDSVDILRVLRCGQSKKFPHLLTRVLPAKRTKIDDLLAIGGIPAPPLAPPTTSLSPAMYDEIRSVYTTVYAPGIDKFLETRWFQWRGEAHLLHNARLCEQFAALIKRFNITQASPEYNHATDITKSLEATVVWGIMGLCRVIANTPNPTNGQINYLDVSEGVHDAARRVEIFETLVLGQYLDGEPLASVEPTRNGPALADQLKNREQNFWRLMHSFLRIRDDEASSAKEIDDTLTKCRGLLDSRENRDVIYSIAIARHLGQRMAEFPDNLPQPTINDENDARTKLFVAKKFIEDEANGKGTTQVIQRLCGMAVRSWTVRR